MENNNCSTAGFLPLTADDLVKLKEELSLVLWKIDNILAHRNIKPVKLSNYIMEGVCSYYDISPEQLKNYYRGKDFITKKKHIAYLLREYACIPLIEIAKLLGYKNHGTVLHHVKHAKDMLSDNFYHDDNFKKVHDELLKYLRL